MLTNKLIIHHIYLKNGSWTIAYELRGEWMPRTAPLLEAFDTHINPHLIGSLVFRTTIETANKITNLQEKE